jgi:large subunit ribosomal protein L22
MRASLQNYHQAPRKVRLVIDLVRGKSVEEAIIHLRFLPKRASLPIANLIQSAIANALNKEPGLKREDLYIKEIAVGKGMVFKRSRPGAHGRAFPIKRKTSHVTVKLKTKNEKLKT